MMASTFVENEKYKYWLKSSLSLHYMKEGLVPFIENQSKILHKNILNGLKSNTFCFVGCSTNKIQRQRSAGTTAGWSIKCPNNTCNRWLETILKHHSSVSMGHCPSIAWDNTDLQKWPTHYWEMAKVFQPYGCQAHKSAKDADSAAILELLSNCSFFHTYLSSQLLHITEVKDFRNMVMHSSNLEVEEVDLKVNVDKMVRLLEAVKGQGALSQEERDGAAEAMIKIDELRSKCLGLGLNNPLEQLAHKERLMEIERNVKELQMKMKKCEKSEEEVTSLQQSVMQLKERTSKTEAFMNLHSQLDLGTKLGELATKLAGLQTQTEKLRAEVRAQAERADKQEAKISCLNRKVDTHAQELCDNKQEIKQIKRVIDATDSPAKKLKAEQDRKEDVKNVQDHLLKLYNDYYCQIPIYPLRSYKKEPIVNLYVQPRMKILDPSDHTHARNKLDRMGKYVKSYRDIFYTDSKRCRRIYVSGEAGVGKSSLCEWMVHLWCRVQEQQNKASWTEDERVIAEFPLLFLISLRISCAGTKRLDQDEVEEMIKQQLSLTKYDVARLLEMENCLIILDGLDEWKPGQQRMSTRKDSKDLPVQHSLGDFTVVTTSRPWKMEILRSEIEGRVDKLINISGLGESTKKLANNVIELLNIEYNRNKKLEEFMTAMKKTKLEEFMDVPVLLMQLVCLWHDGVEFGKSECDIYCNMIARLLQYAEKEKDLPDIGDSDMSETLLPNCLEIKPVLQRHRHLLHSISNLAFHTLFSQNKETSLVFDHEETHIYGMKPDEQESCLKIGLLSQKVCSELKSATKDYKSISFMHKTHQEFFAAVYLSTQAKTSDIYDKFWQAVSSLDRAIEYEKVLLFVCGMNPVMGTRLSEKIMEAVSLDPRIEEYRTACIDKWYGVPLRSLIEEIQKMLLKCLVEASNNETTGCCLRLDDVAVIGIVDWDGHESVSMDSLFARNIHGLNISHAKSLIVVTPRPGVPSDRAQDWLNMLEWFPQLQGLEKIYLYDRADPSIFGPDKVLSIVRPSKHTLRSLVLMNINFDVLRHGFIDIFPDVNILESFSLEKCSLLHEQLEMLSDFLSKSTKLKQLKLNNLYCKVHYGCRSDGECHFSLDLSSCSLKQLYLGKLFFQDLQVCTSRLTRCELNVVANERKLRDLLESLAAARALQELYFRGRQTEMGGVLAKVLPELIGIQYLTLRDINFGKHIVSLSSMNNLRQIKLVDGCISNACLRSLVDSLPSHRTHRIDVHIQDMEIVDTPQGREKNVLQYIRDSPQFVITNDPDDDNWLSESTASSIFFYTR